MQCPKCKRILDDSVRFCPNDGTPLVETGATQADSTPTGGRKSTSRELDLPVTIGGRYRLEEFRGGGGMAKVYRAVDVTLEREVAVKLINQDLRSETEFDARFQREARIASQLADPHIVVVHDFGLDTEYGPFLVMEYLQGQSLRERLATDGPLPIKAGLQLAAQLVLALIHAHGKGIVHRDIKPDNVFLLNQSGVRLHVRVLDFGIARIYRGDDGGKVETITHAGAVLGTPRYMSPEQLAGQPVDARSDIYSTALLIYESLTGQLPYLHGKKLTELCPEASPALEELVEHCLKPSPADRPQNAVEVYLRLQELGKASGILLLPPGSLDKLIAARKAHEPTVEYVPQPAHVSGRKRSILLLGGGLLALVGLVVLAKILFFPGSEYFTGPERLHNIRFGHAAPLTASDLGLNGGLSRRVGNPWKLAETRGLMKPVLQSQDLQLDENDLENVESTYSDNGKLIVLFSPNKEGAHGTVVGILSTDSAGRTNRRVGIGSSVKEVERRYAQEVREIETRHHAGHEVQIYRYPYLGLAFEIEAGRVAAIALYPPRQ